MPEHIINNLLVALPKPMGLTKALGQLHKMSAVWWVARRREGGRQEGAGRQPCKCILSHFVRHLIKTKAICALYSTVVAGGQCCVMLIGFFF